MVREPSERSQNFFKKKNELVGLAERCSPRTKSEKKKYDGTPTVLLIRIWNYNNLQLVLLPVVQSRQYKYKLALFELYKRRKKINLILYNKEKYDK